VRALGAWAQVISLKVGSTNTPNATFTASIAGTTMTVTAVASGTLAVGQTVAGPALPAGNDDHGSAPAPPADRDLHVSNTLTIGSEAMKTAKATLDDVETNIDQVPTIAAANIIVSVV
jgi:hypothetical protein